jgi:hypothetical protein
MHLEPRFSSAKQLVGFIRTTRHKDAIISISSRIAAFFLVVLLLQLLCKCEQQPIHGIVSENDRLTRMARPELRKVLKDLS